MIHTTRWTPDTCGCVIEYTWDDSEPEDTRQHVYSNTVQRCTIHAALNLSGLTHFNAVHEENTRKNGVLALGQAIKASLDFSLMSWSFDAASRTLTINSNGQLTTQQRNTLQTQANNRFGAGKVIIQ